MCLTDRAYCMVRLQDIVTWRILTCQQVIRTECANISVIGQRKNPEEDVTMLRKVTFNLGFEGCVGVVRQPEQPKEAPYR